MANSLAGAKIKSCFNKKLNRDLIKSCFNKAALLGYADGWVSGFIGEMPYRARSLEKIAYRTGVGKYGAITSAGAAMNCGKNNK